MKKLLFITPIVIGAVLLTGSSVVNAQSNRIASLKTSLANKAYPVQKNLSTNDALFPTSASQGSISKKTPSPSPLTSALVIGKTCYDLGANNSMGRNIIKHADGTLSFAFTVDDECTSNYAKRGSGYNYWNGFLLYPSGATKRIESIRTGFSQIGLLGNGSEVIFAHKGDPYDFQMSTNGTKGSGTWAGVSAGATLAANSVPGFITGTGTDQALWGRIATGGANGNSIHLIANYYSPNTIKGIDMPMIYSRSTDAGQSWDLQSVMLPGYDSTRTKVGDAEAYAIDADLSTVAILHGGLGEDLTLWKSTDNGTTFTRTFVDSFPFAPSIDINSGPADTVPVATNDGGMSVVIAPNGTVHVAFSTERVVDNGTPGDGNYFIFPGDIGLVYWNDNTKQQVNIPITNADIDSTLNGGNNTGDIEIGQYTTNINPNNGDTPPSGRYGSKALLSIPSISVDGNNVFILFSLITDGDSTVNGQSFRDVWVVASQDGGATWGAIQNVTCTKEEEEYYISLAKRVDDNLHILYQWDAEPGNSLQNGDAIVTNEIRYAVIDKAKVLSGTAHCSASTGVAEQNTPLFNIANYPNPASGVTYFDVTMKKNAGISLEIFNHLGQQIYVSTSQLSVGKHTLSVDASSFSSGLYFYRIKSGDAVVSGKMTVVE